MYDEGVVVVIVVVGFFVCVWFEGFEYGDVVFVDEVVGFGFASGEVDGGGGTRCGWWMLVFFCLVF